MVYHWRAMPRETSEPIDNGDRTMACNQHPDAQRTRHPGRGQCRGQGGAPAQHGTPARADHPRRRIGRAARPGRLPGVRAAGTAARHAGAAMDRARLLQHPRPAHRAAPGARREARHLHLRQPVRGAAGMAGPLLQQLLPDRPEGRRHPQLPPHQHRGLPLAARLHDRLPRRHAAGEGVPGGRDRARPAGGDPLRRDQRAGGRPRLHDAGRRGHPPPDQLEILRGAGGGQGRPRRREHGLPGQRQRRRPDRLLARQFDHGRALAHPRPSRPHRRLPRRRRGVRQRHRPDRHRAAPCRPARRHRRP